MIYDLLWEAELINFPGINLACELQLASAYPLVASQETAGNMITWEYCTVHGLWRAKKICFVIFSSENALPASRIYIHFLERVCATGHVIHRMPLAADSARARIADVQMELRKRPRIKFVSSADCSLFAISADHGNSLDGRCVQITWQYLHSTRIQMARLSIPSIPSHQTDRLAVGIRLPFTNWVWFHQILNPVAFPLANCNAWMGFASVKWWNWTQQCGCFGCPDRL